MTETTCGRCHGLGCLPHGSCVTCHGKGLVIHPEDITITLPIGFKNGVQVVFEGMGHQSTDGRTGAVSLQVWYDIPPGWVLDEAAMNFRYTVKRSAVKILRGLEMDITIPSGENITVVITILFSI